MGTNTHTLVTPTVIAREALRLLVNNLVMGNLVYRDYETEFPGMPKTGGSVQIRKPVKFRANKTRVRITTTTITEAYVTLSVATQAHVTWEFKAVDLTLSVEQYSDRYIRPAAATLANQIDADLCALYKDVYNMVYESTGFVTPNTFAVLGKAMQKLDEEAAFPDDRVIVLNPAAQWSMANALSNWNFPQIGEPAAKKGKLGQLANATIYMDQNIKTHTVGKWATDTAAGTTGRLLITATIPTGIGAGQDTGNKKLVIQGFAQTTGTSMLKQGDTFVIDGVYAVNPMSGESTGSLRSFVVTADVVTSTESTAKDTDVYVEPACINTGPYQTVLTVPAAGAKVWVDGSPRQAIPQNLAFHSNAFALCMVPLTVPDGVSFAASASDNGYSIRVVKDYDIDLDTEIIRLDVLYGVKTIYPELACRIAGAAA